MDEYLTPEEMLPYAEYALCKVLRRRPVADYHLRKDLSQEAILALLETPIPRSYDSALRKTFAYRRFIDHLRKREQDLNLKIRGLSAFHTQTKDSDYDNSFAFKKVKDTLIDEDHPPDRRAVAEDFYSHAIKKLSRLERLVVELRLNEVPGQVVAKELDITNSWVSQTFAAAITKLRRIFRKDR